MPPEPSPKSELTLPLDLLSAVQRHLPDRRGDFQVESLKPSLVERMFRLMDRDRSRG